MNRILASVLISLCTLGLFAQPKVLEIKRLTMPVGVEACDPVISGDGSTVVVVTNEGLSKIAIDGGRYTNISGDKGAYGMALSYDGASVAWHDAIYDNRQRRHVAIKSASTSGGSAVTVREPARRVSTGLAYGDDIPFASISYGHLQITYPNGTTQVLDPQGRGSYLWPQVSPDGTKVVYWKVGAGCFVCNIDGSNPRSIGSLRATVWAGNDYVVGMMDEDDGMRLTASRLILSDLNGHHSPITEDALMAVNPSASADGSRIVFNSAADNGIYLITLDMGTSASNKAQANTKKASSQTVRYAPAAEQPEGMRRATSNLSDLRVYINAGHGAWGPGDRPMNVYIEENGSMVLHTPNTAAGSATNPQYPDTLAFYESNTDLWKCFGTLEYLRKVGIKYDPTLNQGDPSVIYATNDVSKQTLAIVQNDWGAARDMDNNIVMSRVKNGPWPHTGGEESSGTTLCNRILSVVAQECQNNNFDVFLAVHSDAGKTSTGNHHLLLYRGYDNPATEHVGLTQTHQQLSRRLAELSWNHSYYLPYQTWNEGPTKYIKGDVNFYGSGTNSFDCFGYLGALRHQVPGMLAEGYCHSYGPSRHRAMNPEVDAIEGYLYGRGIADYLGLQNVNQGNIYGLIRVKESFSASSFVPNTATNDKYRPINGATVKLYDSANNLVSTYVTDNYYNGAFVFLDLEPGRYRFTVEKEGFANYEANVNVSGGKETLPEVFLERTDIFKMTQDYSAQAVPGITGTVKRTVASGDYLYILTHANDGTPKVTAYNHKTRSVVRTLGTSICEGEFLTLSDIGVTTDGVLLGINEARQERNETTGVQIGSNTKIYKWENDANGCAIGEATLLHSVNSSAYFFKVKTGTSMAVYGSLSNGYLFFTAKNIYDDTKKAMRVVRVSLADGSCMSDRLSVDNTSTYITDYFGDYLMLPATNDRTYIIVGSETYPFAAQMSTTDNVAPTVIGTGKLTSLAGNGINYSMLNFSGRHIVAVPKDATVNLVDITESLTSPTTLNTQGFGAGGDILASTAVDDGFAVIRMNGSKALTKYSYSPSAVEPGEPTDTPTFGDEPTDIDELPAKEKRAPMAFNLRLEGSNVVKYSLTEQAEEVNILLENTTDSSVTRFAAPTNKGENTFTVPLDQLPGDTQYRWSVEVSGAPIASDERVFRWTSDNFRWTKVIDGAYATRIQAGGVQLVTDPEADNFGYIIGSFGFGEGIRMFRPDDFSLVGDRAYNNATLAFKESFLGSPYRIAQRGNITYISDFSDSSSDIRVFDPASPTTINSAYGSGITGPSSNGTYKRGSTFMGSTSLAIAFTGTGADTKMWLVAEDYTTADALLRYDIGEDMQINVAPVMPNAQLSKSGLLSSQNTSLCPAQSGLFIAQMTTTNTASEPALIYIDFNGNVLYNSGTSLTPLPGSATGVALNADESMLAISVPQEGIRLYNVSWNGNVPTLSYMRTIEGSNNYESEVSQMQFDAAGNLYTFQRSPASLNAGLCAYTLKNNAPLTVTPAKASLLLEGEGKVPVTGSGTRNELAYDLVYNADSKEVSFKLTGDAPKVEVVYHNDTYGAYGTFVQDLGGLAAGSHTFAAPISSLSTGSWEWSVRVHSAPVETAQQVMHEATPVVDARGGVLVIDDRNSSRMGYIVTSTGKTHGFKVYSPDLEPLESHNPYYATNAPFVSNDRNSPYHVTYHDGIVYATDWSADGKNIYMFDPHNPTADIESYFTHHGGVIGGSGAWNIDGWKVSGSPSDVVFTTSGGKEYLWMFTDNLSYTLNGTTYTGDVLARFELDSNGRVIANTRTVFPNISNEGLFKNIVVSLFDTGNGLFVSQKRTLTDNNAATVPSFVYIDYDGNVKYNSGSSPLASLDGCGSGLALNSDMSLMAISDTYGRIRFYSVDWVDNVPSFTLRDLILGEQYEVNSEVCQIAFDRADNLYAFVHHATDATKDGLYVYGLPTSLLAPAASSAPRRAKSISAVTGGIVTVTPANEKNLVISNTMTVIKQVGIDNPLEQWYTIDGVALPAAPTAPGIYIKRVGTLSTKVIRK